MKGETKENHGFAAAAAAGLRIQETQTARLSEPVRREAGAAGGGRRCQSQRRAGGRRTPGLGRARELRLVGLGSSPNSCVEVPTPGAPVCDCVWGQGVYGAVPVKVRSLVRALIPDDG